MKARLYLLLLSVGIVGLWSCDKDDDGIAVSKELQIAFTTKYPSVSRVSWEAEGSYMVADFRDNGYEASAWFSSDGQWYMTELDIPLSALPELVDNAFKASEYAAWRVDDVDKLEREGIETIYVLDLEQGNSEVDLYYSDQGVLVKVVMDDGGSNGGNDHLPPAQLGSQIRQFIEQKYPGARIADIDTEHGVTEVDIIDQNIGKEVIFDAQNVWISTSWDVRVSALPAAVINAINASQFGGYTIDDTEFVQTLNADYYLLELESGAKEAIIKVDAEGNIIP